MNIPNLQQRNTEMSAMSLRFIRPFLHTATRPRVAVSIPRLLRLYSPKRGLSPLAPSRPDLQPQARRKQLLDKQIDLYPRIQNTGVIQTFDEFKTKFSAIDAGAIDDKQLVTIRGVYHYCSSAIPTRPERRRDIVYYRRSLSAEKKMGCIGIFVHENPIYFYAIEFNFLVPFSHRSKAELKITETCHQN